MVAISEKSIFPSMMSAQRSPFKPRTRGESEIRYYSARVPFNSRERRLVAPDAIGIDGGQHHGGDGTIWSGGPLRGSTVFLFIDEYLSLATELEAALPGVQKVAEHIRDGETVYLAYLIPYPDIGDTSTTHPP